MSHPVFLAENRPAKSEVPNCQVVKAGDFLYLSGVTARGDDGKVVGIGDIKTQTRQIFANIKGVLALAGCELTDIIKLNTYLATPASDLDAARQYFEVRLEVFGAHRPASTGVNVAGLMLPEMLVEVEAVAYAPHAVVAENAMILGGRK
jgi:2-iminobutanoate/2-iminopropanoate deaminase